MAVFIDQQIAGLNIAVDHADLMSVIESLGCLPRHFRHGPHISLRVPAQLAKRASALARSFSRNRGRIECISSVGEAIVPARIAPLLMPEGAETRALDELHCVVVHAAGAAYLVHRDDVTVVQVRGRMRLILEPLELPRV